MRSFFIIPVFAALLALAAGLPAAEPEIVSPTAAASVSPVAAVVAPTPVLAEEKSPARPRLSLGIGYPDVRVRGHVMGPVDLELKVAGLEGVQAYGLRLYVPVWKLKQGFEVYAGGEASYIRFDGIEGSSGSGWAASPFLGIQYHFAKRWSFGVDLGPSLVQLTSGTETYFSVDGVANVGLYYDLF